MVRDHLITKHKNARRGSNKRFVVEKETFPTKAATYGCAVCSGRSSWLKGHVVLKFSSANSGMAL